MKIKCTFPGAVIAGRHVPSFSLETGQCLRIGFNDLELYKQCLKVLSKEMASTVIPVEKQGARMKRKALCFSVRAGEFLESYSSGLSATEQISFLSSIACLPNERLSGRPNVLLTLVFLKVLTQQSTPLLFGNAGDARGCHENLLYNSETVSGPRRRMSGVELSGVSR